MMRFRRRPDAEPESGPDEETLWARPEDSGYSEEPAERDVPEVPEAQSPPEAEWHVAEVHQAEIPVENPYEALAAALEAGIPLSDEPPPGVPDDRGPEATQERAEPEEPEHLSEPEVLGEDDAPDAPSWPPHAVVSSVPDPTAESQSSWNIEAPPYLADGAIRAAGGVVWSRWGRQLRVLLIHRPKYDDWSLPKGKADPGESDAACALREVREETGLSCWLGDELTTVTYADRHGRPKTVRYFAMQPVGGSFEPHPEVDEIRWVSVDEASRLCSYQRDAELVATFAASHGDGDS